MSDAVPVQIGALGLRAAEARPRDGSRLGRLTNLQVLRALAAGFVTLLHAALHAKVTAGDGSIARVFNFQLGILGVALFFAMSGFLMAQLLRATDPRTFLVHRVARIYPVFLVVALAWMVAGPPLGFDVGRDWLAISLVPAGPRSYPLGIEWTLLYETTFYVGLFLLAAAGLRRHLERVALVWLALIAAAYLSGHAAGSATLTPRLHYVPFSDVNVAFAGGLLVPWAVARGWLPARLCLLAAPAALALVWAEVDNARWWLSATAVLLVAGAVQIRQVSAEGLLGQLLVRLGDWSYALYLVHMPVILATFRLAPASASTVAVFVASVCLSVACAAAVGTLDVALYRRLRRRVDALSPRRMRAAAWGFALLYLAVGTVVAVGIERREALVAGAEAAVSRLPAGSLADERSLRDGIAARGLAAPDAFVAGIDRAGRMPNGQILVVGWAVDLARPKAPTFLAIGCGGRVVAVAQPQRLRPDLAAQKGWPALRQERIGFTAATPAEACPAGTTLVTVFVDAGGRLRPGRELGPAAIAGP